MTRFVHPCEKIANYCLDYILSCVDGDSLNHEINSNRISYENIVESFAIPEDMELLPSDYEINAYFEKYFKSQCEKIITRIKKFGIDYIFQSCQWDRDCAHARKFLISKKKIFFALIWMCDVRKEQPPQNIFGLVMLFKKNLKDDKWHLKNS